MMVKIHAITSDSLSRRNKRPKIHVPQSSGSSARILISKTLYGNKHKSQRSLIKNSLYIVISKNQVLGINGNDTIMPCRKTWW